MAHILAVAQFNTSTVSDVQLTILVANGMVNNAIELAALSFTAVDHTGREASILIPGANAEYRAVYITTTHNDFIPGFVAPDDIGEVVNHNREASVITASYTAVGDSSAMLILRDNNDFALRGSDYISVSPTGKYRTENGKLFLSMGDYDIIFLMDGNRLMFESGAWLENWVEKGTVFNLTND